MEHTLKIALISVYVIENNGIRFLAASLRRAGFEVTEVYFKDYVHHHFVPPDPSEYDLLIDLLKSRGAGLVGVSLRAGAYLQVASEITERVRNEMGVPVMWGGPHVSMAPDQCIEYPDFLVLGEAEQAVLNVAEAIEKKQLVADLPNVWIRTDQSVKKNALLPLCQDLDSLPFRDFHSIDDKFSINNKRVKSGEPMVDERMYLMLTSRGCAYNCKFCDVSALRRLYKEGGKFFRYRSVENVLAELEYIRNHLKHLRLIRFDDELFVPEKNWIEEFAEKYPKRIGLPFEILSDPRCLDEFTIRTLRGAGLKRVMVGIQSTASVNRSLYNRVVSDERVIEMARDLKRHGVMGIFQVIIDDPENTEKDQVELLELLLALPRPYDLITFSLCHWPGSGRTLDLLEKGIIEPEDIEGQSSKVLHQFLADFSYKRPAKDTFYLALYGLASKRTMPKFLVRRLAGSQTLKSNPGPLVLLAKVMNLAKLGFTAIGMILDGEISWNTFRRWLHIFSSPSI